MHNWKVRCAAMAPSWRSLSLKFGDGSRFAYGVISNAISAGRPFVGDVRSVEEPAMAADAAPDEPEVEADEEAADFANIALEEVIKHLNIDDIIENLL